MGKAKKRKTADFHKPKLKVGKRKPVGTNVTNTEFKTSSINITSQLEETNDPKTKRNHSLKDLLSQLNHYNATIRHEACLGFRDLFQTHPETLHEQISIWIPKIFDKITDIDPAVRHSFQLCIQYIMKQLVGNEVSPFMHIIVAYICCGMTHINEGVQIDSLSILELILEKFPELLSSFGHKILPSLTDLVSKQGNRETNSTQTLNSSKVHRGISSIVSREASFNVEGKMSSLKAKTKILGKVHKILSVLFAYAINLKTKQIENISFDKTVHIIKDKQMFTKIVRQNPDPLLSKSFSEWVQLAVSKNGSKIDHHAVDFLHNIYPVLLNSWIEFEPGQLSSGLNDSTSIRASLPGMSNILAILDIFICLGNEDSNIKFFEDSGQFKDFSTHFLHYFALPLRFTNLKVKSIAKQETTNNIQRFAIDFNFVMAKALCQFFLQKDLLSDSKLRQRYLKQLMGFCTDVLENSGMLSKGRIEEFIGVFNMIMQLKLKLTGKEENLIDCNVIIQHMTECYSRGSVTSPWKIPLLNFFKSLCFEQNPSLFGKEMKEQIIELIRIVISNMWSLPSSASRLIKASVDFVKMVAVYKFCTGTLGKCLEESITSMTEVSNGLYQHMNEETFRTMVEIIYSMPKLQKDIIRNSAILCHQPTIKLTSRKYLMSIIGLSLQKTPPSLEVEDYVNFILSVVIGHNFNELNQLNSEKGRIISSWSLLNLYYDGSKESLLDYAIEQLKTLNNYHLLWEKLMAPIGKFLAMFRQLPVSTAHGIVKLLCKLSEWTKEGDVEKVTVNPEINQIADLISAVLLYTVSETYKSSQTKDDGDSVVDEDLIASTISLLSNDEILLRQLVKKWINIVREYDMDASCVISIAEVLLSLLQEPVLNASLRDLKSELLSITNIQMKAATRFDAPALQQLKFILTQSWG